MQLEEQLKAGIAQAITELYGESLPEIKLEITNKDFEGDYTFVVFPLLRVSKKKPEETATEIGEKMLSLGAPITAYNVVKGFLNLVLKSEIWTSFFGAILECKSVWISCKQEQQGNGGVLFSQHK